MEPLHSIYWIRYVKPNGFILSLTRYPMASIKEKEQEKRGVEDELNITEETKRCIFISRVFTKFAKKIVRE